MASETDAAAIHRLALQAMLDLPKLYGPNGFINYLSGGSGGPPAELVAALERLETATVDPAVLTGPPADVAAARTVTGLNSLAGIIRYDLYGASTPLSSVDREQVQFNEIRYPTVAAGVEADAQAFTPGAMPAPVRVADLPAPPASGVEQYLVTNVSAGVSEWQDGQAYAGPVAKLQNQFVTVTRDKLNITATKPNNFIHGGSGDDAIDVSLLFVSNGGTNVLDGGGGSNFLVGGYSSTDTFFVDDRSGNANVWSTVAGFHKGDAVTIYGVTASAVPLDWEDGQGTAGFTGLTLHAAGSGRVASLTLAGYGKADLGNGRLAASFGTDPGGGGDYLFVRGN